MKTDRVRFRHGPRKSVLLSRGRSPFPFQLQSAGIYQREAPVVPGNIGENTVAGGARQVFDNGNPLAARRFSSVDLPTFWRPIIATMFYSINFSTFSSWNWCAPRFKGSKRGMLSLANIQPAALSGRAAVFPGRKPRAGCPAGPRHLFPVMGRNMHDDGIFLSQASSFSFTW